MEIFIFCIMIVMVISDMIMAFVKIHGTVHQKVWISEYQVYLSKPYF